MKRTPIKKNGMMLTTNPGLSGMMDDVQNALVPGAIALGGAAVMGVGTAIPGKAKWGFVLLGLAGMGFGGYKLYEVLSKKKIDTDDVPPPKKDTVDTIMSGGQATAVGGSTDTSVGKAAAFVAGSKGGTGKYYREAMDALGRMKQGYVQESDLNAMLNWYNEIKYNSEWTTTTEFKEVTKFLVLHGKISIVDQTIDTATSPLRWFLGGLWR